jgi:predicted ester cyclase
MPSSNIEVTAVYKDPLPIAASADAYVRGGDYADANYGSDPIIEIKTSTANLTDHREGFLKFDLSSLPETVSSARLRIHVNTNTGGTRHSCFFVDDDSWTEDGITYNNKPVVGTRLDTKGVPFNGNWIEFDVTNQVINELQGDKTISFQIADELENIFIIYESKEGANAPILSYGAPGGSNNFTITANPGSNGSITPGGSYTLIEGSDQTFSITPDTFYEIEDVLVDGVSVGAVSSYTFTNVTEDHTISASFLEIITHTITASADSDGSITPAGNIELIEGSDQTFTIIADTDFEIEDVLVDGTSVGAVSSYTFTNVTSDHTISVSFVEVTHTIKASAESNGSITPEGDVTVIEGFNQTFFIGADPGYEIGDVLVDGSSVGAVPRYTFNNVTADHTISASFVQVMHSITASAGSNGSITPEGTITVAEGSDQTFDIVADTDFEIEDVLVDGTSVGAVSSYTFTNVKNDHSIVAEFVSVPDSTNTSAHSIGNMAQSNSSIMIFPNPTDGEITIRGIDGKAYVRIVDLLGKEIMNMQFSGNNTLNLSRINAGIYFIEVRDKNRCIIERLIKE